MAKRLHFMIRIIRAKAFTRLAFKRKQTALLNRRRWKDGSIA
jgi:hypothetical protein